MPAFIPALTRQMHAQFPRCFREIHQALSGDLDRSGFIVHVAVDTLSLGDHGHPRPLLHLVIAMDNLKADLASWIASYRHAFNPIHSVWLKSNHWTTLRQ